MTSKWWKLCYIYTRERKCHCKIPAYPWIVLLVNFARSIVRDSLQHWRKFEAGFVNKKKNLRSITNDERFTSRKKGNLIARDSGKRSLRRKDEIIGLLSRNQTGPNCFGVETEKCICWCRAELISIFEVKNEEFRKKLQVQGHFVFFEVNGSQERHTILRKTFGAQKYRMEYLYTHSNDLDHLSDRSSLILERREKNVVI